MPASQRTKQLLAYRSGNVCAWPDCTREMVKDDPSGGIPVNHGKAAHIEGEREGSARHNPNLENAERNGVGNLMFLCQEHHDIIDNTENVDFYPTSLLQRWKAEHETKVRAGVDAALADISFSELAVATEWVRAFPAPVAGDDLSLIPPAEKIARNELSAESGHVIAGAILNVRLVGQFVDEQELDDPDFAERLKAGFLSEYFALRQQGIRGDELFELMCAFSQRGMIRQSQKSAGLAVLVYLFEKCDVFER